MNHQTLPVMELYFSKSIGKIKLKAYIMDWLVNSPQGRISGGFGS